MGHHLHLHRPEEDGERREWEDGERRVEGVVFLLKVVSIPLSSLSSSLYGCSVVPRDDPFASQALCAFLMEGIHCEEEEWVRKSRGTGGDEAQV